jgi:hypothetical protein
MGFPASFLDRLDDTTAASIAGSVPGWLSPGLSIRIVYTYSWTERAGTWGALHLIQFNLSAHFSMGKLTQAFWM